MSPDIANLVRLATELKEIAAKNGDKFRLTLEVSPIGPGRTRFELSCVEREEGHDFVSAAGIDLNETVERARAEIDGACESWDYKRG